MPVTVDDPANHTPMCSKVRLCSAYVKVHRWGEAEIAGQVRHPGRARGRVPDCDQAFWLRVRQWPEKHAVDDAEDGRIGADTDGQRQKDNGGEGGCRPSVRTLCRRSRVKSSSQGRPR